MSKSRVLIMDDDTNLSRLSGMILENSGQYEVMIVSDCGPRFWQIEVSKL
jgi:hypothetical protein